MDKRYITGTIFLTIAVILTVVFVEPKYREVGVVSASLTAKGQELDGYQYIIKEVGNINKEFAPILKNNQRINDILPKSKNIADLLVEIDYIISRNGLIAKDVSFSTPIKKSVRKGEYYIILANLKISGSYDSFLNFSEDIKNNKHLMDIVKFSISRSSQVIEEDVVIEPIFDFDVSINAYYQ